MLLFAQGLRRDGPPTLRALVPDGDEARRAHIAETWRTEIAPHFQLEEDVLLPALEGHDARLDAEVSKVREDHRWLEGLRSEAEVGGVDEAHALGVALVEHTRMEERGIFTLAQEILGDEGLATRLGNSLSR